MKVMTFNVQHFLDYENQVIDFQLFSEAIRRENVDFCGLNEVRGAGELEGYSDQTDSVGALLGLNGYFGEAIKVNGIAPYGNAFFTEGKIQFAETIKIKDPFFKRGKESYETRCIIKTVVELEGKDICFLVCHIGLNKNERKNAVRALCRLIDKINLPLILMGDFNAVPEDKALRPLFKRLEDTAKLLKNENAFTYPSYNPEKKIDYILYRGLRCKKTAVIEKVISDHFPVTADFDI